MTVLDALSPTVGSSSLGRLAFAAEALGTGDVIATAKWIVTEPVHIKRGFELQVRAPQNGNPTVPHLAVQLVARSARRTRTA